jgi:hypothetical protein
MSHKSLAELGFPPHLYDAPVGTRGSLIVSARVRPNETDTPTVRFVLPVLVSGAFVSWLLGIGQEASGFQTQDAVAGGREPWVVRGNDRRQPVGPMHLPKQRVQ